MGLFDLFRRRATGGPAAMRARLEGAMAKRRLRGWNPPLENINSLVASGGPRLLARARELVVTNGYAANACEAFAANLVGDGIKPSSLIEDAELRDRIQRLWLAWTDEADADGLTDFYGLQAMVAREMFVAGECFVRLRPRRAEDGLLVPLQLQLLQSEMLPFEKTGDGGQRQSHPLRHRVRRHRPARRLSLPPPPSRRQHRPGRGDPGDGARAGERRAAHLPADRRRPDPGPAACGARDGAAVPARPVRRRRARPEEDRGDVRGLHHQDRARRAADGRDAGRPTDGTAIASLEPGTMQVLLPGEDVKFSSPADVGGGYEAFQYRTLLAVSASLGLPYHLVTGDVRQANYSSLRAELVEFRRRVRAAAARGDRASALPPDLGALDGSGGAGGSA